MNVSSVSSSANSGYAPVNNSNDLAKLEKQKAILENELQEVNQSKMDEKTKQQKVKLLQLQIQQIDAQIQQAKETNTNNSQNSGQAAISAADSTKGSFTNNRIDELV